MEAKFGDKISVTGIAAPGVTGKMEVQIVGGKLLHSKIGGDGYVDTDAKLEKIYKGIEEAIGN